MEAMDVHRTLKRKGPDDLVEELLNVTLSPAKRSRFTGLSATGFSGLDSKLVSSDPSEGPWGSLPGSQMLASPSSPSPTAVPNSPPQPSTPLLETLTSPPPQPSEQKALVLYKPVTPPLFPGGPPAGSVDFPYKLTSSVLLPLPQGTDRELIPHQLDCQSACSDDTEGLSGHGLFQALDLSGSPGPSVGFKRLGKVSSCSSIPRFAAENEDQAMVEDSRKQELAVIPWVPMTPLVPSSGARPFVEDLDEEFFNDDLAEPMEDDNSMDIVDASDAALPVAGHSSMTREFGSPIPNFGPASWQADTHQPSINRTMWSH